MVVVAAILDALNIALDGISIIGGSGVDGGVGSDGGFGGVDGCSCVGGDDVGCEVSVIASCDRDGGGDVGWKDCWC